MEMKELPATKFPEDEPLWLTNYYYHKGQPQGGPTIDYYEKDSELHIDLGLRPDGIVVWRLHETRRT